MFHFYEDDIKQWDTNHSDQKVLDAFLKQAKELYQIELDKFDLDKDDEVYFSWANSFLHIYLIRIANSMDGKHIITMATPLTKENMDDITYLDFSQKTDNGLFLHSSEDEQIKMLFSQYGLKNTLDPQKVIKKSIFQLAPIYTVRSWINAWISKELSHAKEHFSISPINLEFNDLGLHPQKFKINEITKAVNDKQFTREFQECIAAFKHEFYYPAACGLGGVMESLLHKTLENYGHASSNVLTNDPTLGNYLTVLKKYGLVDRRQQNRIKASFMIRNSISHFNKGFTEVSDIENMLHGVENIFSSLFLQSQEWKKAHPNQRLPKLKDQKE